MHGRPHGGYFVRRRHYYSPFHYGYGHYLGHRLPLWPYTTAYVTARNATAYGTCQCRPHAFGATTTSNNCTDGMYPVCSANGQTCTCVAPYGGVHGCMNSRGAWCNF